MDTNSKTNEDTMPLSPEDIKAIGEIAIGPSRHEQFLNAHYRKLMWGGITLGIVAGGVIAYFSHCNDMRHEAAAQVVQAMKITAPVRRWLPLLITMCPPCRLCSRTTAEPPLPLRLSSCLL